MRFLCPTTLGVLLMLPPALSGSIVVALRTGNAVYMAADSRRIDAVSGVALDDSACKLQVLNDHQVIAVAGIERAMQRGKPVLDVPGTLRALRHTSADWRVLLPRLDQVVSPGLLSVLIDLYTHPQQSPERYDRYFRRKASPLQLLLIGPEADTVGWQTQEYGIQIQNQTMTLRRQPVLTCGPGCERFAFLGYYEAADALAGNPLTWRHGPAMGVENLVRAQTAVTPNVVGGPISVLMVDKAGVHWIKRGVCQ